MKLGKVEFGVIFVDNKRIHELNKEYRNIDRETDVITFRLADYEEVKVGDVTILGDIYISLDKAKMYLELMKELLIKTDLVTFKRNMFFSNTWNTSFAWI